MPSVFTAKDRDHFKRLYGFLSLDTVMGQEKLIFREQNDSIMTKLSELIGRYMIRRVKSQVQLNLPPKVEVVVYCPLTKTQ